MNTTSTAFQKIGTDRYLQDHWLRRAIAGIIDYIIILIVTAIISWFIPLPVLVQSALFSISSFDLLQGFLFFLYSAVLDSTWGSTIGKQIMNLKVTTTDGRLPTIDRTLIRDVSKIHPLLWLIDTVVGMASVGDPHQKISDRFAGTTIVSTIQRCMILPTQASPPP